jgi:hypothetical protein
LRLEARWTARGEFMPRSARVLSVVVVSRRCERRFDGGAFCIAGSVVAVQGALALLKLAYLDRGVGATWGTGKSQAGDAEAEDVLLQMTGRVVAGT